MAAYYLELEIMTNKKIIIIGASSGIGKELAILYAKKGYRIGITGRRADLLKQLQVCYPQQIFTACFDVMGPDNISSLKKLIEEMEGMDILLYNSGYGDSSATLDWEIDRQTTLTNVNGFLEIVHFAYQFFLQQGHGHIAATSSIASIRGNSWAPAYSASKAYMSCFMEGLHMKAAKTKANIIITDIQPGFVRTKMAKGNGQFWVSSVEKAAKQIQQAIENKKRIAYISRRWWIIAKLMKILPYPIYKRMG